MALSTPVINQLNTLTEALNEPGTDLRAIVDVLLDDLTATVPSALGLSITSVVDRIPVAFATADPTVIAHAKASLQLPLSVLTGAAVGSTVEFYAGNAGAFVDLAADVRWLYDLDGQVVVDGHLPGSTAQGEPVFDWADFTVINRAIGVLIGDGSTPDEADVALRRCADHAAASLPDAARRLLHQRQH